MNRQIKLHRPIEFFSLEALHNSLSEVVTTINELYGDGILRLGELSTSWTFATIDCPTGKDDYLRLVQHDVSTRASNQEGGFSVRARIGEYTGDPVQDFGLSLDFHPSKFWSSIDDRRTAKRAATTAGSNRPVQYITGLAALRNYVVTTPGVNAVGPITSFEQRRDIMTDAERTARDLPDLRLGKIIADWAQPEATDTEVA